MSRILIARLCLPGALFAVAFPAVVAGEPDATPKSDLRVRGVFTSEMPAVERRHSLRLLLHPHFGDLTKYDYFRTDMGLRYSLSDNWEISGESASYFGHGLGHAPLFNTAGFGELRFRTKYRVGDRLKFGWDSAVGGEYSSPVGHPPSDVTDGLEHIQFFATFARPLRSRPGVKVFWSVGIDLVEETSNAGRCTRNDLRDDNHTLSGGMVIDHGLTHYTLEAKWRTTRVLGRSGEDVFELRPVVIREFGQRRDGEERSRWLLGLALSTIFGPDGTKLGLGARVRVDFDFKRLLRGQWREVKPFSSPLRPSSLFWREAVLPAGPSSPDKNH